MRKAIFKAKILFGLTCLVISAGSAIAQPAKEKLPALYQQWLDEEVVDIISPLEREVFLKLASDRERDLFITDRGRIYIILGEPNDIQRYEGKSETYPAEVWFYQDKSQFGLPPGFHIVFFQPGGVGESRLFSPAADGPQALLIGHEGDPVDFVSAYRKLKELEPSLAEVSLSLIPGEETTFIGRPSLSSDLLIQRVETTAQRMVEEKYARKFLEYKDIVEVEYTANYIDSESLVKLVKDPGGLYFVHFALEPARLSVGQYEQKYYAALKLNGSVATPEGTPVFQFERVYSLDLDEEKMAGTCQPTTRYICSRGGPIEKRLIGTKPSPCLKLRSRITDSTPLSSMRSGNAIWGREIRKRR